MALREILADLRVRVRGTEQLRQVNSSISSTVGGLRRASGAIAGFAAALGGAAAVGAARDFTSEMIRQGDEIGKNSARLRLSAAELQQWQFAAEHAGVGSEQLVSGLSRLDRTIYDANRGAGASAAIFRELGIATEDANGNLRSAGDVTLELADALGGMADGTRASAIAQQVYGRRAGFQMMTLFAGQRRGIERLMERQRELGGGMSNDMVRSAEAAADAMTDFDVAIMSIKSTLAESFLPGLTETIGGLTEFTASLSRVLRQSSVLRIGLNVLKGLGIAVGASLAAIAAPVVVPLGIVIALVDDLVTMFRGGESVIGNFIDGMAGVGTTAARVKVVTEAVEGLLAAVEAVGNVVNRVFQAGGLSAFVTRALGDGGDEDRAALEAAGGALASGTRRVGRAALPMPLAPPENEAQGFRRRLAVDASALMAAAAGGRTIPATALGGGVSRQEITQHIGAPVLNMTIQAAQNAEETARVATDSVREYFERQMGRAAAILPQGGEPDPA